MRFALLFHRSLGLRSRHLTAQLSLLIHKAFNGSPCSLCALIKGALWCTFAQPTWAIMQLCFLNKPLTLGDEGLVQCCSTLNEIRSAALEGLELQQHAGRSLGIQTGYKTFLEEDGKYSQTKRYLWQKMATMPAPHLSCACTLFRYPLSSTLLILPFLCAPPKLQVCT